MKRRRLLLLAGVLAAVSIVLASSDTPAASAASHDAHAAAKPGVSPQQAMARLTEGNARFVAGKSTQVDTLTARRTETLGGQHPFAVILTCADSRVPPEHIFDQGIGDLFVIRNAGNILDDHVIGSIEYAVEHLHSPLVVVLGHSKCGAVTAAVGGGEAPGHIKSIVTTLSPAVGMAKKKPGDPIENAIRINSRLSASALEESQPILHEFVKAGKVKVVAARYDLATGMVEFLP